MPRVSLHQRDNYHIPFNHLRECHQLKILTLVNRLTVTGDEPEVQLSSSVLSDMSVSTMAYLESGTVCHDSKTRSTH